MIRTPVNLAKSLSLILALAFANGALAQFGEAPEGAQLIRGGWLFDGVSGERVPNPGILIRDGVIVAVGYDEPVRPFTGINQLLLDDDQTVLPGFFDLHAHYNYDLLDQGRAEEVRYTGLVSLANGVTSTWSAGEYFPERVLAQRDRIDRGEEPGPRLFASGPYMGGFRCEYAVRTAADDCIAWPNEVSAEEIRAEVDYWAGQGVISLKIKQATPDEARVIIDQAQKHGMTTAGHLSDYEGGYDVDPRVAIPMGLDRLEHNITLGSGGPRSAELDEVIDLMLEYQVYFDANLQMYGGVNLRQDMPDLVWTDEAQYFTPYARALLDARGPPPPESDPEEFAQRLVELRKFYDAGGSELLIVGTDEPIYTTLLPGFAYHRELQVMEWAGIPASDVLRAATINGARALGVDDRLGSIEPGKLADLVVIRGNPLEDIKATRDMQWVVKNGVFYQPAELLNQAVGKIGPAGPDDHDDWILHIRPMGSRAGDTGAMGPG